MSEVYQNVRVHEAEPKNKEAKSKVILQTLAVVVTFSLSLSLSPSLSPFLLHSGLLIVVLGYCRDSDIKET